jgi:sulfite reductase beta subunit-like hemoprotein
MATIKLETDSTTGDLVLPLSDELMREVGWKNGDTIRWTEQKDGSWHLTKVNQQLELFDEKDEAVLELMKENQRLKTQVENLTNEIKEYKQSFDNDDWK